MKYDENEQEPLTTPDTSNRTKINSSEGSDPILDKNGRNKWERLSRINTGAADSFGNRDETVTRSQERAASFDIVADQLHLIDSHKREGREIMKDRIDTELLSRPGSTIHLISFCVAAYLVNRDNVRRSYHPERAPHNNDDIFREFAEDMDFDRNMINSLLQKVGNQL